MLVVDQATGTKKHKIYPAAFRGYLFNDFL